MTSNNLKDRLADYDGEVLLADGFDDAFLGLGDRCGQPTVAVYDREACLGVLMQRDGMSHEDAEEFFDFNVAGAWVGEGTPIYLTRIP
jgi:hypothetical protein